jgi:ABC-type multidrug transport system fused ATPase/permease subunit
MIFIVVQGALVLYEIIAVSGTSLLWIAKGRKSSRGLHSQLLRSICAAPTWFFDTTPLGRLISRFSRDVNIADVRVPNVMEMTMTSFTNMLVVVVAVCLGDWWMVIPFAPIGVIYFLLQKRYRRAAIEIRRLEGTSRSPIYVHFDNTLSGLISIRAYDCSQRFRHYFAAKINENGRVFFNLILCQQWFALRLDWLGAFAQLAAMLSLLCGRYLSTIDPGLAALALSNMSLITQTLGNCSKNTAEAEQVMQSVERIMQYCDLPKEEPDQRETEAAVPNPDEWPSHGAVAFDNYSLRYRPELPCVLKGITCRIEPGEKIGVVGRTGSGKSSMLAALFRIVEPATGSISIDGVETKGLRLEDLRSKLTIIPQDPTLFSGTVRYNLDPCGQYADEEIWRALELSFLREHVDQLEGKLDAHVSEGGDNFSLGQRQLMCMARALLRRSKIIALDEATASIDVKTDVQIQSMIRTQFVGATIFTIAHRLHTIMDSSRVMVLEDGQLVEFDTALNLVSGHPDGVFASMVRAAKDELLLKLARHEITLEQCLHVTEQPPSPPTPH